MEIWNVIQFLSTSSCSCFILGGSRLFILRLPAFICSGCRSVVYEVDPDFCRPVVNSSFLLVFSVWQIIFSLSKSESNNWCFIDKIFFMYDSTIVNWHNQYSIICITQDMILFLFPFYSLQFTHFSYYFAHENIKKGKKNLRNHPLLFIYYFLLF